MQTRDSMLVFSQVAFPQLRDTLEKAPSSSLHAYYEVRHLHFVLILSWPVRR